MDPASLIAWGTTIARLTSLAVETIVHLISSHGEDHAEAVLVAAKEGRIRITTRSEARHGAHPDELHTAGRTEVTGDPYGAPATDRAPAYSPGPTPHPEPYDPTGEASR